MRKKYDEMTINELSIEKGKLEQEVERLKEEKYKKTIDKLVEHFEGGEFNLRHKKDYLVSNLSSILFLTISIIGVLIQNKYLSGFSLMGNVGVLLNLYILENKKKQYKEENYHKVEEKWKNSEILQELDLCPKITKKLNAVNQEIAIVDSRIDTMNRMIKKAGFGQRKSPTVITNVKHKVKKNFRNIKR